jgi:hypothetical protein
MSMVSTPLLGALGETKKEAGPKKESSRFESRDIDGNREAKGLSYGELTIPDLHQIKP